MSNAQNLSTFGAELLAFTCYAVRRYEFGERKSRSKLQWQVNEV
jgi:hypothetical protein